MPRSLFTAALLAVAAFSLMAQEPKSEPPKKEPVKYKAGDRNRPRPKVVEPGTASTENAPGKPPADAVLLFDGKDLAPEWIRSGKKGDEAKPLWKIENGYAEIAPRSGGIMSIQKFGDSQIHIEWATPKEVKGNGQGRGNSGIHLGGFGEVQILDSYDNDTYPDGQAGALYGKYPPLVNASRKPGEWQIYDIIAHVPRTDDAGKVIKPGKITVLHNGVVVHHATEFNNKFSEFTINIQDHGNPVRFRNIWVRKLADYDVNGDPAPKK